MSEKRQLLSIESILCPSISLNWNCQTRELTMFVDEDCLLFRFLFKFPPPVTSGKILFSTVSRDIGVAKRDTEDLRSSSTTEVFGNDDF